MKKLIGSQRKTNVSGLISGYKNSQITLHAEQIYSTFVIG